MAKFFAFLLVISCFFGLTSTQASVAPPETVWPPVIGIPPIIHPPVVVSSLSLTIPIIILPELPVPPVG